MPESCQITTVSAAILCSAICISDVMNKEEMSDESVKHYITSQPLSVLLFIGKK